MDSVQNIATKTINFVANREYYNVTIVKLRRRNNGKSCGGGMLFRNAWSVPTAAAAYGRVK